MKVFNSIGSNRASSAWRSPSRKEGLAQSLYYT